MSASTATSPQSRKILILEPYYGGSHKVFIEGLRRHLPDSFDLLTSPARKWKWRMRLSAPYLAEKLHALPKDKHQDYRCVLCSTFVDVATLRSLAPQWVNKIPILTYFHENQFSYPVQVNDERDFHFALTNYTTALASDRIAFNSRYNRDSFLAGCRDLLRKAPDMKLADHEAAILAKSEILYPGFDFTQIDTEPSNHRASNTPVIVWNHRWEHDKNPELFFSTLFALDSQEIPFKVIVMGESFKRQPAIFEEARRRLGNKILHFGYVDSRQEYVRLLKCGDVVVSCADHEFYGIAVIEGVRAGCRPILPRRLSYPELFPQEFLYDDGNLREALIKGLKQGRLQKDKAIELTEQFSWTVLAERYQHWFGC